MQVVLYPQHLKGRRTTTLVLGAFEGIHNGHVSLFAAARQFKRPLAVMVIENPENLPKHPGAVYAVLTTRLQQLANLGVEYAVVVKFTPTLMRTSGVDFLANMVKLTNARAVVTGDEFAMGAHQDWRAREVAQTNPLVHIVPPLRFNQAKLATRTLRELVQVGDMKIITKLAPFPYTVEVRVDVSRTFHIATVEPQRGVYAVAVVINAIRYWGVARIGMTSHELIVPQLQAAPPYAASVEFYQLLRVIVAERQDAVSMEDERAALVFLSTVL